MIRKEWMRLGLARRTGRTVWSIVLVAGLKLGEIWCGLLRVEEKGWVGGIGRGGVSDGGEGMGRGRDEKPWDGGCSGIGNREEESGDSRVWKD